MTDRIHSRGRPAAGFEPAFTAAPRPVRRWYVTSAHRVVRQERGSAVVPFAVGHLKEVGSAATACGLPALDWPIFWDLPLSQADNGCPECAGVLGLDLKPLRRDSAPTQGLTRPRSTHFDIK